MEQVTSLPNEKELDEKKTLKAKKGVGHYIKISVLAVISSLVILLLCCGFIFRNDIRTIKSLEKIDDYGLFYMDYYADYGLDKLIAQGGAGSDSEIVEFTIKQVLKGLPVQFEVPDFGCATFQAETPEGDWIFGRNYDLDYVPSLVMKTTPENGYASIGVGNMSILMYDEENLPNNFMNSVITLAAPYIVMDGMNEMGLSIGVLLIRDDPTYQTGQPLSMTTSSAIRYILDKAKDVEEAITLFETMNMRGSSNASFHYQLADSSGNSAIIEYIGNELNVIHKNNEHSTPMVLTNFLVSEEVYGFGKGHDRYEIIVDSLDNVDYVLTEEEAMAVLESAKSDNYDVGTGDGSDTQWSVVYNNSDLTMDICVGANYDKVYSFSLFD